MKPNCGREDCQGCSGHYLCNCLRVTEEAVVEAIAGGSVRSFRDLHAATGAGTGCTACHSRLQQVFERYALSMAVAVAG
jgi:bacterioferritin-associated ferredoxin